MRLKKIDGKKGYVVLVHGLGEHCGRYTWLIDLLRSEDYGLIMFDLPGHGENSGKKGHATFREIFEILDGIFHSEPDSFLMGHSLGGLIAIRYAELKNNVRGLIVTSPALKISNDNFFLRLLATLVSVISPKTTFNNGIDPYDLSPNIEAVKRYINDPLVHEKISAKLAFDMLVNSKRALREAFKIKIPCFIGVGEKDKITLPEGAYLFFNRVSSEDKTLKTYHGGYHELFEDPANMSLFLSDFVDWLRRH